MWHLIPTILYLSYSAAQHPRGVHPEVLLKNDRPNLSAAANYPVPQLAVHKHMHNVPGSPANLVAKTFAPYQRSDDSFFDHKNNIHSAVDLYYHSANHNNLRQVSQTREVFDNEGQPLEFGQSSDAETNTDSGSIFDHHSYSADLALVENFGNYLKKRTQLDGSSSIYDPAHQYDALLAVLVALATVVRNSCNDFDQVYDRVYLQTVESYYQYSLNNAEKVAVMIDDYIRKGNSHITKLRKLKQDTCEKEFLCSVIVDNKIKSAPLIYVKELETLEALTHLARSYYQYIEDFNQAAKDGDVLLYLQNNKDSLKEYVMHIVNSLDHITDDVVRCP